MNGSEPARILNACLKISLDGLSGISLATATKFGSLMNLKTS